MKWAKPDGSVQYTEDRKFCVVKANSMDWIAYEIGPTTGNELGVRPSEEAARTCCEDYEREMTALRRAS